MEETRVERVEDFVEIKMMTDGGKDAFASAGLADVFGLFGDGLGGDMAAVAISVMTRDGLLIKLGEQDMSDRVMD